MDNELLTTQEFDVMFDGETRFEQMDHAANQAIQFNCRLVSFGDDCFGGGFQVKYIGTQENLDHLLEEIGYDFETQGFKWEVRRGESKFDRTYVMVDPSAE